MRHKRPRPAVDPAPFLYQLARDADGFVHCERGYISAKNYEAMRVANPDAHFPRWQDLPRLCDLEQADLEKLRRGYAAAEVTAIDPLHENENERTKTSAL